MEAERQGSGGIAAAFAKPMSVDIVEIVMVGLDSDGSPLVLTAADDNFSDNFSDRFSDRQGFLLMLFRLGAAQQ